MNEPKEKKNEEKSNTEPEEVKETTESKERNPALLKRDFK